MKNNNTLLSVLSKGTLGAIPIIGPMAAEVVGQLIPNQRIDRIESYLEKLEEKISLQNSENIIANFKKEESIDLFEESIIQASKALTEERKEYIAQLLANSLSEDEVRRIEYKRLLQILAEINDVEILYLKKQSFLYYDQDSINFDEKHSKALNPKGYWDAETTEERDAFTIFLSYAKHLISLGLLKPKYQLKKGELPEFDAETGTIKSRGYEVTYLGKMLLKSIGLQTNYTNP